MSNPALVSLALVKVNWDKRQRGFLDMFAPMVAECVRLQESDVVSVPDLQSAVRTRFGLELPQNVIKSILRRVRQSGYVYDEKGAVYRDTKKLEGLQFHDIQRQTLEQHESLVGSLAAYAKDEFGCSWSSDESAEALLRYLETHQLVGLRDTGRPAAVGTSFPTTANRSDRHHYVVASFVRSLEQQCSPQYEYVETVVKGNMLANAIFLADPGQIDRRFHRTEIYFDTGFLIFALGYAGRVRQEPCAELLALLYELGADLRCFRHTCDEVHGVLYACQLRISTGRTVDAYGPSVEYFVSQGVTASDIELYMSQLESNLQSLRIEVVDTPSYDVHKYVVDETALSQRLRESITYHKDLAVERDVRSISAIVRLRAGYRSRHFEDCRALMVTPNSGLVSASRRFFQEQDEAPSIPVCVTDHVLTSLLWVKRPLKAPDLPRKRLIADCYAAMQPSPALWNAYMAEVARLENAGQTSPEDVYLLRYAVEAKLALMELTLGEVESFTQGTVPEILQVIKDRIAGERQQELHKTVEQLAQENATLQEARADEQARTMRLEARANRVAASLVKALGIAVLALLALAAAVAFPKDLPPLRVSLPGYLVATMALVSAALSIWNLYYGVSLKAVLRQLEIWCASRINRLLVRISS